MSNDLNSGVKDSALEVLRALPENVSWDEMHYRLYVREQIEAGLANIAAGRLIDTQEIQHSLNYQSSP